MAPLDVFSQEWVVRIDAEQLEAISGEPPTVRERRAALLKKQDLEDTMRILRY
jgi:hypothetical protein